MAEKKPEDMSKAEAVAAFKELHKRVEALESDKENDKETISKLRAEMDVLQEIISPEEGVEEDGEGEGEEGFGFFTG